MHTTVVLYIIGGLCSIGTGPSEEQFNSKVVLELMGEVMDAAKLQLTSRIHCGIISI